MQNLLRIAMRRMNCLQCNLTAAAAELELVLIPDLHESEESRQLQCPADKKRAIEEALEHFQMI